MGQMKQLMTLDKRLRKLEGAYAPNTLHSYYADVRSFVDWYGERKIEPFPLTSETLCYFIEILQTTYSYSSIRRRISALRRLNKLLGFEDQTHTEEVYIAIRRLKRTKCLEQRQAVGINHFAATLAGDFFNELKPRISACANQRSGGARIGSTQQRAIILCHSAVMRKNLTYCKLTKAALGSAGFASATQGQPAPQRRYTNHPAPPKDPQANALRIGCFADHLAVGASHQAPSLTAPKR